MRIKRHSAIALVALAVIGCGGGGGGSNGGSTANRASVGVFVTDDLGAYDHVWVTVKKIDLVGPAGTKTLFTDADGKAVDLASLNDAGSAVFAFLGVASVPAGIYTRIEVTLDDDLVLFPAGAAVGLDRKFAGSADGLKKLLVEVDDSGEDIRGDDSLVVDFDLARWNDDGTTVTAFARVRDHEGLDDHARHHDEDYHGVASSVTTAGFTLTPRNGGAPIAVTIDAGTVVFGDASILTNGQRVEVRGFFDTTTRTLTAASVKIEIENGGEDEVRGNVVTVGASSFTLTIGDADGFLPTGATMNVTFGANTRFRGRHGVTLTQAEFLAALTAGAEAEAEGSYDATTNTLTATKLKLEGEDEGGHHGGGDDNGGGDDGHGGGHG